MPNTAFGFGVSVVFVTGVIDLAVSSFV